MAEGNSETYLLGQAMTDGSWLALFIEVSPVYPGERDHF
ncbi:unnamed protein product [Acidithrix sp. C25]|nr:unnamed protein product [Acidithrix sp. C25]